MDNWPISIAEESQIERLFSGVTFYGAILGGISLFGVCLFKILKQIKWRYAVVDCPVLCWFCRTIYGQLCCMYDNSLLNHFCSQTPLITEWYHSQHVIRVHYTWFSYVTGSSPGVLITQRLTPHGLIWYDFRKKREVEGIKSNRWFTHYTEYSSRASTSSSSSRRSERVSKLRLQRT